MNIERKLKDKAVIWRKTGQNKFNEPEFAAPVEIKCRWEQTQIEFRDRDGEQRLSDALVIMIVTAGVDDYLFLGELGDLPTPYANPLAIEGEDLFKVERADRTKNLRNTTTSYEIYL